jgi:hypothetical protein
MRPTPGQQDGTMAAFVANTSFSVPQLRHLCTKYFCFAVFIGAKNLSSEGFLRLFSHFVKILESVNGGELLMR